MRRVIFSLLFLLIIPEVRSQVICYEEAKRRAEEFFNHSERRERPLKSGSLACADTLLTICAPGESPGQGGLNPASGRQEPLLYIFNRLDGEGFVILSADERVGDVLAWSSDSRICEVIPPMKVLLDQYSREIVFAREKDIEGGTRLKYALTARSPLLGNVGWSQGPDPFNTLCPYDAAAGRRCPLGCVATAMAQVIYYYKYPRTGTGSLGYPSAYGVEWADFSVADYRYEEMSDQPWPGVANPEIAELNYHCAVAVETEFGPYGSSAFAGQIVKGLQEYFKYKKASYITRTGYSQPAWRTLLKYEIDHARPLIYSAIDPWDPADPEDVSSGHAFVIDGYDDNDLFHINWGWGGCANGYYSLELLNPDACGDIYTYTNNHAVVTGIEPLTTYECRLSVDPSNLNFTAAGGTGVVTVTSNTGWTATSDAHWIEVSPAEGTNNGEISIRVLQSSEFQGRSGILTLKGCDITRTITVVQEGTCELTVPASPVIFPVSGGSITDTIVSPASWMITDAPSWLTVSPTTGNGKESVVLTASSNEGNGERECVIIIAGCGIYKSVRVIQQGSCVLTLSSQQEEFPSPGGSVTVQVTSNSIWEATVSGGWLTLDPRSGIGSGVLTIVADSNRELSLRSATILVSGCNTNRVITVTQEGFCRLEVSPLKVELPAAASVGYMTVNANSAWSAVPDEPWINVSPSSGRGTSVVAISISANTSGQPRTGKVIVSGCNKLDTIDVAQQSDCVIGLSSTLLDFSYLPGSKSFTVTSRTRWSASCDAGWISFAPKSGSLSAGITVQVPIHTGIAPRSGAITITGCGYSRTVKVEQGACSLSVSEDTLYFSPEPGTRNLVIQSNAPWSATVNDSWITLSASGGNRDATTGVTVEANPSGKRSAVITISGCFSPSVVKVVQEALPTPVIGVEEARFRLYPSPAHRYVHVDTDHSPNLVSLDIFTGSGHQIMNFPQLTAGMVIDLGGHPPGFYFFRFSSSGRVVTKMVVLR